MSILLQILVAILSGLAKSLLGQVQAENDAQQVGATKQAQASESQANEVVKQVLDVRAEFKPYTADKLHDIKPGTDANFRD